MALLLLHAPLGCGRTRDLRKAVAWEPLRPGLEFAEIALPGDPSLVSYRVQLLRADPRRFEIRLLAASADPGRRARTPQQWVLQSGALAAINASMYMTDGITSVALMRGGGHVNNPSLGRGMAVLLSDPVDTLLPGTRVIERDDPEFNALLPRYRTAVQDLRIVASRPGPRVVWKNSAQKWSQAAFGQDSAGRILFVFSRAPHNPSELGRGLLQMPLGLRVLAHAEGSYEAALCIHAGSIRRTWTGRHSSGPGEGPDAEPIPNVIAIFPRQ